MSSKKAAAKAAEEVIEQPAVEIGDHVLYYPGLVESMGNYRVHQKDGKPMHATVAFVGDDGTATLSVLDHAGSQSGRQFVPVIAADGTPPSDGTAYCQVK